MGLRDRAKRLFKRRSLSENSVAHSKVDEAVLRDWRKRAPKLDESFSHPGDTGNTKGWERLGEDVFYSFFGEKEPSLHDRDAMDPAYRLNRELVKNLTGDEDFMRRRPETRNDPFPASLATIGALAQIDNSGELDEHRERQEEMLDTREDIDELDDYLEQLRIERRVAETGAHPEEETQMAVEDIDSMIRETAKKKRELVDHVGDLEAQQQQRSVALAEAAKVAAGRAMAAAEQAVENAETLDVLSGGKSAGMAQRVGADKMFELAERVQGNRSIKDVLDMLGRLELSMSATRRTQRKGGYEEIVDIELGDDLPVILPQEKVLLTHPVGRLDFYRRYSEQAVMQYDIWSETELKRGSGIMIADGSASMAGAKNVFARGLGLAFAAMMNREHRDCALIEFGGPDQAIEYLFPKGKPLDPERALDFAEHFFKGGTSTLTGLRLAKAIMDAEAPFHSADIVILTDGIDHLTDEDIAIRDELVEMGVRIHGITIGCAPTPYLLEMAERTHPVWEFAGPNNATDRLAIDLT